MTMHEVVSKDEWVEARKRLLAKEKEFTRMREQLSAEQRPDRLRVGGAGRSGRGAEPLSLLDALAEFGLRLLFTDAGGGERGSLAPHFLAGAVELGTQHDQDRLLRFELPGTLGQLRRLLVEFRERLDPLQVVVPHRFRMIEKPAQTPKWNLSIDRFTDIQKTADRFVIGRMETEGRLVLGENANDCLKLLLHLARQVWPFDDEVLKVRGREDEHLAGPVGTIKCIATSVLDL